MKSVQIVGVPDPVEVETSKRLLDALLRARQPVLMACGAKGLCATCHVYVENGADGLGPRTKRETSSLRMLRDVQPTSRLACQAKVLSDGVKVALPSGRFITGTKDLEGLIGRRAESSIMHPLDGRVLIQAGKIITRSRISQLSDVDLDVAELRRSTMTLSLD